MKRYSVLFLMLLMVIKFANALELPKTGEFVIKQVDSKKVLYVHHKNSDGHISNSIIKLVQYYLLKENDDYEVIFPQFSMERYDIDGSYVAIEYKGNSMETQDVKTTNLEGGLFASYVYKGSYKDIGEAIRASFQKVQMTGKYIPHNQEEIRLLYWNSIDNNQPKDLVTEIQVRVKKLP